MKAKRSRREFISGLGALTSYSGAPFLKGASAEVHATAPKIKSPFQIAVMNDEVSQDFERSCKVISHEFGLNSIELRGMWNKNILKLDANEIYEAKRILKRYDLQVTDICSPLFKVNWPGAPVSKFAPRHDQFMADYTYEQQGEVLERCIETAKIFGTNRVRFFDFWRLDDQAPYRAAINEKLLEAADKAGKNGITLMLENEFACNTATGAEAARVMEAVQSPHLMLLWDAANAAMHGERAFPDGYRLLPKNRVAHCHCKDLMKSPRDGETDWMAVGSGSIDWVGQFRALKADGYGQPISLETQWRGAGTAEASTRQSWHGMQATLQKAGALRYSGGGALGYSRF
jgi:L-ribulose-5-phosphate 3-epimerase